MSASRQHRLRWLLIVLLGLLPALAIGGPLAGAPAIALAQPPDPNTPIAITFDADDAIGGLPPGSVVSTQYQTALGVTFVPNAFSGSNTLPSGQGTWANNTNLTVASSSGTDVGGLGMPPLVSGNLLHAFNAWLSENGDPSFSLVFDRPIASISIDFAGVGTIASRIFAYDASNALIATQVATSVPLGNVQQQRLTITSATPIVRVAVVPGSYNDWVGVDNIRYIPVTPPAAPTARTLPATAVGSTQATLNGLVRANNLGTAVNFVWGTTPGGPYPNTSLATPATVVGQFDTPVSSALTGLLPNTTYYFRVTASNPLGEASGDELSFTTAAVGPSAITTPASGISGTAATLNALVNANNSPTNTSFEWGTLAGGPYPNTLAGTPSPVNGNTNTAVSANLTGLVPNTTYFFRIVATSDGGNITGGEQSFTTTTVLPTVDTGAASAVTATSATLNGTINPNNSDATMEFVWGTTAGGPYPNIAAATPGSASGTTAVAFSAALNGLAPNTSYYFRATGTTSAGTATGAEQVFTTSTIAPVATTNPASAVTGSSATLNGSVDPNNASTSVRFEWGTSSGSYPNSLAATPPNVTGGVSQPVSAALSGLTPNVTYYFRVVANNSAGTASGGERSFVTTQPPTAVTLPASNVNGAQVTFNGRVNANNATTTVRFEWGSSPGGPYPNSVAASPQTITGLATTVVRATVTGLPVNASYYYRVVASSAAGVSQGDEASFEVRPNVIRALTGTGQIAQIGTPFDSGLQAQVRDAAGQPVAGVPVVFTAPTSGPSGTFTGSSSTTVTTDAAGVATAPPLVANRELGSFIVTAASPGTTAPALFNLVNQPFYAFLPQISAPESPNLEITSVILTPRKVSFQAGEPVTITVRITNTGAAPAAPFWVDLYLNPARTPAPNLAWNLVCGMTPCYGVAWGVVGGLQPGASVTLTTTAGSYVAGSSIWPGYFAAGTSELFVLADSWNPGNSNGAATETNEADNLFVLRNLTVTGPNPPTAAAGAQRQALPERPTRPPLR